MGGDRGEDFVMMEIVDEADELMDMSMSQEIDRIRKENPEVMSVSNERADDNVVNRVSVSSYKERTKKVGPDSLHCCYDNNVARMICDSCSCGKFNVPAQIPRSSDSLSFVSLQTQGWGASEPAGESLGCQSTNEREYVACVDGDHRPFATPSSELVSTQSSGRSINSLMDHLKLKKSGEDGVECGKEKVLNSQQTSHGSLGDGGEISGQAVGNRRDWTNEVAEICSAPLLRSAVREADGGEGGFRVGEVALRARTLNEQLIRIRREMIRL